MITIGPFLQKISYFSTADLAYGFLLIDKVKFPSRDNQK